MSKNDDKDIEHCYVEINLRKKNWLNENNVGVSQFELFRTIPLGLLNESAPSTKKIFRNNQSSFVTKEVRKAIITRSRLRKKFLKTKSQEYKQAYNKQKNLCATMVRKEKKKKTTLITSM